MDGQTNATLSSQLSTGFTVLHCSDPFHGIKKKKGNEVERETERRNTFLSLKFLFILFDCTFQSCESNKTE